MEYLLCFVGRSVEADCVSVSYFVVDDNHVFTANGVWYGRCVRNSNRACAMIFASDVANEIGCDGEFWISGFDSNFVTWVCVAQFEGTCFVSIDLVGTKIQGVFIKGLFLTVHSTEIVELGDGDVFE